MIWCIRMLFGIAQEKKNNLALQALVNAHHATVCSLWSFVVVCDCLWSFVVVCESFVVVYGRLWSACSPLVITCNYIMALWAWTVMANVDAASKDAVLVPDVKAFQKSLHLNAGAFHVFQFAFKGFLMMSRCPEPVPDAAGDNKKYAKAIFKHIAVKEMSGKWGGSIKQRSTSSWLDSIQRDIWIHLGRLEEACHPKNPRDILTNHHKATSQPAEASQSCILRLSGAGLWDFVGGSIATDPTGLYI